MKLNEREKNRPEGAPLYERATLSNGLRIVCSRNAGQVSYIGVAVNAGSRDEARGREGLAHFVEHTIFKGTQRRSSWHVSNRMETIGGELNAYTAKEETVIYTNAPAGYSARAIELLSDIIANSNFPQAELDREREVVVEEINSYLDSPEESVYDEFEELMYAGSGLAHNILGTPATVRSLRSADCRSFLDDFYTPSNMVVYCLSPESPAKVISQIEKHFGHLHYEGRPHTRTAPPAVAPFEKVHDRGGHQAHTIVGARTFGRHDSRRFALFLLNNYLGGPCMNSRLNRELRDRRGLVYTVDSNVSLMSDVGLMQIYFGTESRSVKKCRNLILRELDRLAQARLSDTLFHRIREQYCGQLLVGGDQRESMAMSMGKGVLYYDQVRDVAMTAECVREVTADQVRDVAQDLLASGFSSLSLT